MTESATFRVYIDEYLEFRANACHSLSVFWIQCQNRVNHESLRTNVQSVDSLELEFDRKAMKIKLTPFDSSANRKETRVGSEPMTGGRVESDSGQMWTTHALINIYEASLFLKRTIQDARYQLAQQFVAEVASDPPQVLRSYICVHIIVGQLESYRNHLSAIHIVFLYYWDVVRKDNIINKVLLDLYNNFQTETSFLKEAVVRADKCLKRIEREMSAITTSLKMANALIWQCDQQCLQISLWNSWNSSLQDR